MIASAFNSEAKRKGQDAAAPAYGYASEPTPVAATAPAVQTAPAIQTVAGRREPTGGDLLSALVAGLGADRFISRDAQQADHGPAISGGFNVLARQTALANTVNAALNAKPSIALDPNKTVLPHVDMRQIRQDIDHNLNATEAARRAVGELKQGVKAQQGADSSPGQRAGAAMGLAGGVARDFAGGAAMAAAATAVMGPAAGRVVSAVSNVASLASAATGLGTISGIRGSDLNRAFNRNGRSEPVIGYGGPSNDIMAPRAPVAPAVSFDADRGRLASASPKPGLGPIDLRNLDKLEHDVNRVRLNTMFADSVFNRRADKGVAVGFDNGLQTMADRSIDARNVSVAANGGLVIRNNMA